MRRTWDGRESPAIVAAWAAAPWPLWCLIAFAGIRAPLSGPLAFSIVLALMALWAHRPPLRAALRFSASVIGTGLMGELVVGALMKMETPLTLARGHDLARAAIVWLVCLAIYEVAPIVAAGSRMMPREHRSRAFDLCAHAAFLAIAALAYASVPRVALSGELYLTSHVSPWNAAIFALPLAAARSGPRREARLSAARQGAMWIPAAGLALVAAVVIAADGSRLGDVLRYVHRYGLDPIAGVLFALPFAAVVLSTLAAVLLLARSIGARSSEAGIVLTVAEDGITLERTGLEAPMWIAIEDGPMPAEGSTVTLIGLRERSVDVGPFRDGAPRWIARRVFLGTPRELSRTLGRRAGGWLAWAAASAVGLWLLSLFAA